MRSRVKETLHVEELLQQSHEPLEDCFTLSHEHEVADIFASRRPVLSNVPLYDSAYESHQRVVDCLAALPENSQRIHGGAISPRPVPFPEENPEESLKEAVRLAVELYETYMNKLCDWSKDFLGRETLEIAHKEFLQAALELFERTAMSAPPTLSTKHRSMLNKKIEKKFQEYAQKDKKNGKRKVTVDGLYAISSVTAAAAVVLTPMALVAGIVAGGTAVLAFVSKGWEFATSVKKYCS